MDDVDRPGEELIDRVRAMAGAAPVEWLRPSGGYTATERWSLTLADGRRVFAKLAPTADLAGRLRAEHRHMTSFAADFRCDVLGWEDGARPLLLLEDLRHAHWPPEWRPGDVDHLRRTLGRVAALPAVHLAPAGEIREMFEGWDRIAAAPEDFAHLGLGSPDWLAACLPTLRDAARAGRFDGDAFLHMDVRSDNVCFAGDRCVLVDWNWAVRGDADLDVAAWAPSLRLEGGPLPDELAPGQAAYAAGLSGYFAAQALQPPDPAAPQVRRFQLRQLRISLPWACRELGLPPPDVSYARAEVARHDEDLAAGRISEEEWKRRVEESLIDAYLASDDPRSQSGKSGDEAVWRWARELILDVFPPQAAFLDVGCANGYLLESVTRWGAERGLVVEPYGVDISARIVALARHRLPQWADRIYAADVIDWSPPRRFDVIQAGLDEVPLPRRRELVARLLGFLSPGGRLVFRSGRAGGAGDVVVRLAEVGLRPDGVIEREHPTEGLRRTAWLAPPDEMGALS